MDSSHSSNLLITLISLWGAMLGGALGAVVGGSLSPMACSVTAGFVGGFVFSVLLYLPLVGLIQGIGVFIIDRELEGQPIGCATSDRLSAILGGAAGAVGAVVVSVLSEEYELFAPESFVICWTVVAFVPIILSFALVVAARWQDDGM